MSVIRMTDEQYAAHQARIKGVRKVTLMPNKRGGGLDADKSRKTIKNQGRTPAGLKPEDRLAREMTDAGLNFERQYRWHPGRKYRADFAFPAYRLIVEVEGRVHRIEDKFHRDIEKSQQALILGVRMLRVSNAQVRAGEALAIVQRALATENRREIS